MATGGGHGYGTSTGTARARARARHGTARHGREHGTARHGTGATPASEAHSGFFTARLRMSTSVSRPADAVPAI
ncbi:hypothetical protein, partial [Streptomyces sp. NPDC096012]|uniref:hypothetical protein n=1 Tax=Streptomyces sp. NPDC096012 TaxID=3155684 RepID=UPI00336A09B4